MRNKPMFVTVALVLAAVLVFAIGWMAGSGNRPEPVAGAAAPAVPVESRGIFIPGDGQIDAIRRGVPIDQEAHPPAMARVENTSVRRHRYYPMQPPTIPHSIDGYQVDLNSNRCMLCHGRDNAATFQAPSVSVTHYMDRDGQFLATISPRRYFCEQCHVVQTDAPLLVENGFKDIDEVLRAERARQ